MRFALAGMTYAVAVVVGMAVGTFVYSIPADCPIAPGVRGTIANCPFQSRFPVGMCVVAGVIAGLAVIAGGMALDRRMVRRTE